MHSWMEAIRSGTDRKTPRRNALSVSPLNQRSTRAVTKLHSFENVLDTSGTSADYQRTQPPSPVGHDRRCSSSGRLNFVTTFENRLAT